MNEQFQSSFREILEQFWSNFGANSASVNGIPMKEQFQSSYRAVSSSVNDIPLGEQFQSGSSSSSIPLAFSVGRAASMDPNDTGHFQSSFRSSSEQF